MEHSRALDQIATIHEHLAKGEVYRGYRPLPIALTGLGALLAAALHALFLDPTDARGFVVFWTLTALVSASIGLGFVAYNYFRGDDEFGQRRTRQVVGQFVPCVVAGGAVTVGIVVTSFALVYLLPGLWAILFALGLFASRPYLPRHIGWVAMFYLGAGVGLLLLSRNGLGAMPWCFGGTFALGQGMTAYVLHRNQERVDHA